LAAQLSIRLFFFRTASSKLMISSSTVAFRISLRLASAEAGDWTGLCPASSALAKLSGVATNASVSLVPGCAILAGATVVGGDGGDCLSAMSCGGPAASWFDLAKEPA